MIPTGTPAQQVPPKHHASLIEAEEDERDYPDHVCPGQHCLGRGKAGLHHRHGAFPIHYLTPAQAARATEYSGRVR